MDIYLKNQDVTCTSESPKKRKKKHYMTLLIMDIYFEEDVTCTSKSKKKGGERRVKSKLYCQMQSTASQDPPKKFP